MKNFVLLLIVSFASIVLGYSQSKTKIENNQEFVAGKHPWVPDDTIVNKEEKRFYVLTKCLQKEFDAGRIEDVKDSIKELKLLLPKYSTNWNYGNATHKISIISGRMALRNGKIDEAKTFLIEAGKTQGSPQLNSFGPNMSLAKELLEKGEKNAVLEYFDLCRAFWETDFSRLDDWTTEVKNDRIPDFGANLIF